MDLETLDTLTTDSRERSRGCSPREDVWLDIAQVCEAV